MTPPIYTFELYPKTPGEFEAKLLDVPSLSGEDYAARRAWWTAFHMVGPIGFDPEDFEVREWTGETGEGRLVSMGGFVQ